jgi:hypothetical protein
MTIQELFIAANHSLLSVVMQITENEWDKAMPASFPEKQSTLKKAIAYHSYDDAWVPEVLAGKTSEHVGKIYDHILTDFDGIISYREYNERANRAVSDVSDLERITHLSYGDYSTRDYLQHIVSFRAFRAYDIAKILEQPFNMDGAYAQALLDEYTPVAGLYRQMGVFPEALDVADDATVQERLLAFVGRSI